MPPKASKGSSRQKAQEEQREDSLQAVVLTDSYERGFPPFTLEKPRCLLPLANVPLIEYTLEFIANAGIKDIFLYVGAHEEQVEDYINNSRWMSSTSPFSSLTILRCPAASVGDALRDLDKRDLITGDFVLVLGDLVSNINLDSALSKHRARREKDKNAIMTMVLREAGREHRCKPQARRPFFFIDPQQDRCLHYEDISKTDPGDRRFHLDADVLATPEIEIRGDLIDCGIDICTVDVLGLWTDNFDYKSIRSSFLRGVLQDYELNGKTLHTHIIKEGYASRVTSPRAYNAVAKDIISRWTYPFTPDSNLMRGHTYRLLKNKIYLEAGVVLARGSTVKARSILGKDTSVGDGSTITDTILGRRCQVGKNVKITGCYIWDDVVIGDNSTVTSSIIANEAVVGSNCTLHKNTFLSYTVRLSNDTTLQANTRLAHARRPASPFKSPRSDSTLVGPHGAGSAYEPSDSDSDSESLSLSLSLSRRTSSSSLPSISTLNSAPTSPSLGPRRDSTTSILSSTDGGPSTTGGRSAAAFLAEAVASIQDGILKNDDRDTVRLELMAQRLSDNASDTLVRDAIARALVKSVFTFIHPGAPVQASAEEGGLLSSSPGSGSGTGGFTGGGGGEERMTMPAKEATHHVLKTYSPILVKMGLFDDKEDVKKDQVAVLREFEAECAARLRDGDGPGDKVLLFAVDVLHRELEVLEDEAVLQWWDGDGEGEGKEVRKLVASFVRWVREAESESESEDEDEEDDEEEDD